MLKLIKKRIIAELRSEFNTSIDEEDMSFAFEQIFSQTSQTFVFIIDEWDCVL